jgi:D-alanyl-D-alanine carboxypeptidase
MSATPGHSQHQLGTAVDFTNAAVSYQVWLPFGKTSAYWWLEHHAREYGFVLAYPRGKEEKTGYEWEPWHYRYVGVENAQRLEKSSLSLQEFLEREGVLPRC